MWFAGTLMARKHNFGVGAGAFSSLLENSKIENPALEIELKLHSGESRCHDCFFHCSTDVLSSLLTTLRTFSIRFRRWAGELRARCFSDQTLQKS